MLLRDRHEAGQKLAEALMPMKGRNCVVLALPRGGVPVAAEVAAALDAPMELLLVRTIGAPCQPGLAVGAVMGGREHVVIRDRDMMDNTGTSEAQFSEACQRETAEINRRWSLYCGDRRPEALFGRTVIVVDDGLANGDTMRAALRLVRQCQPRLLVMAVPVMPPGTPENFHDDADLIVNVAMPNPFSSVDEFYDDFKPVTDADIFGLLKMPSAMHALYHEQ